MHCDSVTRSHSLPHNSAHNPCSTTIVFDKTGTLTAGRPTVVDTLLVVGAAAAASGVSAPEVGVEKLESPPAACIL